MKQIQGIQVQAKANFDRRTDMWWTDGRANDKQIPMWLSSLLALQKIWIVNPQGQRLIINGIFLVNWNLTAVIDIVIMGPMWAHVICNRGHIDFVYMISINVLQFIILVLAPHTRSTRCVSLIVRTNVWLFNGRTMASSNLELRLRRTIWGDFTWN